MLIKKFTNQTEADGITILKPCQRILLTATAPEAGASNGESSKIRVKLENSNTGESIELIPEMSFETLTQIGTFSEGFYRSMAWDGTSSKFKGQMVYSVVLNSVGCVRFDSDKYLVVDLRGLNPELNYELYALEGNAIDEKVCRYQKFSMGSGENQKSFVVGENEALCVPYNTLREIQFYTKEGSAAPSFTKVEIQHLMDIQNDIVTVGCPHGMKPHSLKWEIEQNVSYGSDVLAVIDLTPYKSFDIKRVDTESNSVYEFYMIDNK